MGQARDQAVELVLVAGYPRIAAAPGLGGRAGFLGARVLGAHAAAKIRRDQPLDVRRDRRAQVDDPVAERFPNLGIQRNGDFRGARLFDSSTFRKLALANLPFRALARYGSPMVRPLPSLFDDDDNATDSLEYLACRDHEGKRPTRDALEEAWQRFGPMHPERRRFIGEFRRDFLARSWELWLMTVLADAGLSLQPVKGHGPDILIHTPDGARCWIEAVVANPGEKGRPDTVWQRPADVLTFCGLDSDKVMLRYLSVIKDKREKIEAYRSAGIIKEDDACLIALSQAGIVDNDTCDEEVPAVVRAVLGIGQTVLKVPIYSDEPTRVETPPRDAVPKANGALVSTRRFLDGHANGIAGILFASDWVWNLDWEASKSLRFVHNPTAMMPLKRHSIPAHCEMWVEDGWLKHRGRCASFGPYA